MTSPEQADAPASSAAAADTLDYPTPATQPSHRGKGSLAVAASLIFHGLGHFFAGRRRRGAIWAIATIVIFFLIVLTFLHPSLVPLLLVILPLDLLLSVACWIDAYRCGRKSDRRMFGPPPVRYGIVIILLIIAVFANPMLYVALAMRDHWMEAFVLPTASMTPTVKPGDRFLVHKTVPYGRWDLITFRYPENPSQKFVNRIVGMPGEQVELVQGKVYINGKESLPPPGIGPYVSSLPGRDGNGCQGNPMRLKSDEYYVLGDNSPISGDSRYWRIPAPGHQPGAVPKSDIVGRATWIYWPPPHWRKLDPH